MPKKHPHSPVTDRTAESGSRDSLPPPGTVPCPACGSREVLPILYGLPLGPDDRVHLGGCVVREEQWHCEACGKEW